MAKFSISLLFFSSSFVSFLTSLSASLFHPAFPHSAPLLLRLLASALSALVSVAENGAANNLGHLHSPHHLRRLDGHVLAAPGTDKATSHGKTRRDVGDAIPRHIWMLEAKAVSERDAAARALAALVATSGCRKLFKKKEQGIVNVVQLLDPSTVRGGIDARFLVSVLLAVSPSWRCQKHMVAAGACGFL
uniref:Uncharacterized protein n=1 Tax=Oryza sativa subsp. japonica TaxID=39947 RepID=Q2QRQ9_ORYSJ|nr:hypothetical protein LOC_Os12g26720 [Oryza sativa Japonica Group]